MEIPSTSLPKPDLPYVKRSQFTVHLHRPPPPTPVVSNNCVNTTADLEERRGIDSVDKALERCNRHPPLQGGNLEKSYNNVRLELIDPLQGGDGRNAQVVVAQVLHKSEDFNNAIEKENEVQPFQIGDRLVAKIYDPLYFNDEEGYINPFLCVDRHYTHESRAYRVLSEMQGKEIPKFYGSYSLELPSVGHTFRTVRLILIQLICGSDLSTIMNLRGPFSQERRQGIMRSVIDFESRVYERDILLADLFPRNILLKTPQSTTPDVGSDEDETPREEEEEEDRLVFIDFGAAIFGRIRDDPIPPEYKPNLFLGQYVSPLLRWKITPLYNFGDWIDWDWLSWLEPAFEHTIDTITPEMQRAYCGFDDEDDDDDTND